MNKKILIIEAILALVIILGFRMARQEPTTKELPVSRNEIYKNKFIIHCSPDWNLLDADSLGNAMKPLPGWGNYRWNIETTNDSARFYFNQGINMYYAFHIIESLASFKKAALFDPTNPMIYWGQALAYGPNINDFAYAPTPDALTATQKAKQYSGKATAKEKALIHAMELRYTADSTISRSTLNEAYATAMLQAWKQFGQNADISALYADARMLQHPWDYWKHNGVAQPWTDEILAVIETSLKTHPLHPGLNHYHIHMSEASPNPGRALASAKLLETLMPDVSHMVHMPSHIYIRTGSYHIGINVNDMSINGYNKYLALYPDVVNSNFLYLIHNLHLKTACAMMLPDYAFSLKAANECVASIDTSFLSLPQPLGNMVQYIYTVPVMVQVQYAKWDALLAGPDYPTRLAFANAFSTWGKGLAYANTGKLPEAKNQLNKLVKVLQHPDLYVANPPFNKPVDQMGIGEKILEGTIAQKENNLPAAISFFKQAVVLEDSLIYGEPRDWLLPSRQFLANAYILSGNLIAAEKTLKEDLVINPHSYHSLAAMKKVYSAQKNKVAALQKINKELAKVKDQL